MISSEKQKQEIEITVSSRIIQIMGLIGFIQ